MTAGDCQQGYTLMEILIVMIIIGFLAGHAVTRLFSQVEASRSAGA